MKKFKKMMVGVVLAVTLLGNCLSVSAACIHTTNNYVILKKEPVGYEEFQFTHTEQHGATTVVCDVYKVYYTVTTRCNICGGISIATVGDEVHRIR